MCDPESVGVHVARMEAFVWGSLLLMVPPGAPAEPLQPSDDTLTYLFLTRFGI